MGQGNLMSVTAQVHTVKEQHAPEEHREKSHHGDNQVLIEQGDLFYKYLEHFFKA